MVALHSKHKQDKLAGSSVSPKMYEVYCNHADKDHIITKNWENVVQSKWTNCTRTWNGTSSSRTNMANRDVPRFSRPWHHGPQAQWEQERGPARGPVLQVGGLPLPQLDLKTWSPPRTTKVQSERVFSVFSCLFEHVLLCSDLAKAQLPGWTENKMGCWSFSTPKCKHGEPPLIK